jgi:hypothetical protein
MARRRGRHRRAVDEFLKTAECDAVQVATLRGLADRWDQIEFTGDGAGQVPQLAAILWQSAANVRTKQVDALAELERELGGMR